MKTAWVITDGSAGMENQALGLAQGLAERVEIKRIKLRQPWLALAPFLRIGLTHCLADSSDALSPPWPDLIVSCGRRSILPTLMVKKLSKGRTKSIYLQNPKIASSNFDVVVCPAHDNLTGGNVLQMIGAPHHITQSDLENGRQQFSSVFGQFSTPRVGVFIGGPNRAYTFDDEVIASIVAELQAFQKQSQISLLITPSRRTPESAKRYLVDSFSNNPSVYVWDFQGSNPYFGILATADAFVVTCDSVSMVSELCSTDKPVYVIDLPGGNAKFNKFHKLMREIGRTELFNPNIDIRSVSTYKPLQEMDALIAQCKAALKRISQEK